jgi:hypothetical protein
VPRYQNTIPFITKENIPRVTRLIGRVSIFITGLTNILNRVRHAPTIRATHIGLTVTPDIILVVAKTATESMTQCKISFIKK